MADNEKKAASSGGVLVEMQETPHHQNQSQQIFQSDRETPQDNYSDYNEVNIYPPTSLAYTGTLPEPGR